MYNYIHYHIDYDKMVLVYTNANAFLYHFLYILTGD